ISLVFAVPDHPWQKASKKAAVRIAMTAGESGKRIGRLAEVIEERDLDTNQPRVIVAERSGPINPDLSIGVDTTNMRELAASDGLSSRGVQLHGSGFILTPQQASALGLNRDAK